MHLSENIVGKADVGFYSKEKPGMGQALKGQLILTNRRFIYVRHLGGKYLTAKVKVWGTPYFRLRYQGPMGEKVCSLVFVSSMNMMGAGSVVGLMKTPYDQLSKAIEQLKKEY